MSQVPTFKLFTLFESKNLQVVLQVVYQHATLAMCTLTVRPFLNKCIKAKVSWPPYAVYCHTLMLTLSFLMSTTLLSRNDCLAPTAFDRGPETQHCSLVEEILNELNYQFVLQERIFPSI